MCIAALLGVKTPIVEHGGMNGNANIDTHPPNVNSAAQARREVLYTDDAEPGPTREGTRWVQEFGGGILRDEFDGHAWGGPRV